MPYALCLRIVSSFVLFVFISFALRPNDTLYADVKVVELIDEGTIKGVLIGVLDLGEVKAGSTINTSFILKTNPIVLYLTIECEPHVVALPLRLRPKPWKEIMAFQNWPE